MGLAIRFSARELSASASTVSHTCWRVLSGAHAPIWIDSDVNDTSYKDSIECDG